MSRVHGGEPNIKRCGVVKGNQNVGDGGNLDANKMAKLELQKIQEAEEIKKQKIQNFMNNTKLNATKLSKQQNNKLKEQQNNKKRMLDRQKQLKAKYTVVKKNEDPEIKPTTNHSSRNIQWKKAEETVDKISLDFVDRDDSDESGYDSEVDPEQYENPAQLIKFRQNIKKMMLAKSKP